MGRCGGPEPREDGVDLFVAGYVHYDLNASSEQFAALEPDRWEVVQVIADDGGDDDWSIHGWIDLAASASEAVFA